MDRESSFWSNLKDRLEQLAKKNTDKMYTPKIKENPNLIKVEKPSAPVPHAMTPEELQEHMKANRGTGYHKNQKDKRAKNPKKMNQDEW